MQPSRSPQAFEPYDIPTGERTIDPPARRATAIFRMGLNFIFELALLALGWGADDLPGYFANPVRAAVVGMVGLHLLYNLYRALTAPRVAGYRLEHIGVYRLQLMAVETVFLIGPYCDRRGIGLMSEAVRGWGLALFVLGTLGMVWAGLRRPELMHPAILAADSHGIQPLAAGTIVNQSSLDGVSTRSTAGVKMAIGQMGRYSADDFRVGPYRWLRYPQFTGQLIMLIGLALCFRSWTALAFAGMLLAASLQRAREIDRAYENYFGSLWAEYAQVTKRLIPWVL